MEVEWLGDAAFDVALEHQHRLRERVVGGDPGRLLLVEHPACLTLGRRGDRRDVLWSDDLLAARGVRVFDTPRGGEVTLHAPGQLVVYPVVVVGRKIRQHLHALAQTSVALLRELGVTGAAYREDQPGLWIGETKLASIGIHVSRGVAVQGLSLNLGVDPALFGALVSCGLQGVTVASARDFGAPAISVAEAAVRWAELWSAQTGQELHWITRPA